MVVICYVVCVLICVGDCQMFERVLVCSDSGCGFALRGVIWCGLGCGDLIVIHDWL